jgi:hypothetical protein
VCVVTVMLCPTWDISGDSSQDTYHWLCGHKSELSWLSVLSNTTSGLLSPEGGTMGVGRLGIREEFSGGAGSGGEHPNPDLVPIFMISDLT